MAELEDYFHDRGDECDWALLSDEERRCFDGLKKYYTTFEEQWSEQEATIKAWEDVQREHKRLKDFKWYR
jgi:phosphopantetheinyl transferase (holo-ACP synthase)